MILTKRKKTVYCTIFRFSTFIQSSIETFVGINIRGFYFGKLEILPKFSSFHARFDDFFISFNQLYFASDLKITILQV